MSWRSPAWWLKRVQKDGFVLIQQLKLQYNFILCKWKKKILLLYFYPEGGSYFYQFDWCWPKTWGHLSWQHFSVISFNIFLKLFFICLLWVPQTVADWVFVCFYRLVDVFLSKTLKQALCVCLCVYVSLDKRQVTCPPSQTALIDWTLYI